MYSVATAMQLLRRQKILSSLTRTLQPHNESTPIQIHCKSFRRKIENFHMKKLDIFLISALKHRLWVLVRTASARRF